MAIFGKKRFFQRYNAEQKAVDNENQKLSPDCFDDCLWWTETMEYIRVVSGTVYEDTLKQKVLNSLNRDTAFSGEYVKRYNTLRDKLSMPDVDVVALLNEYALKTKQYQAQKDKGEIYFEDEKRAVFLKKHPLTNEVYTVSYMRAVLDLILRNANPDYVYNKYLYLDFFQNSTKESEVLSLDACDHSTLEKIFTYCAESKLLKIDFSKWQGESKQRAVRDFDLSKYIAYGSKNCKAEYVELNARGMVFHGKTTLQLPEDKNIIIRSLNLSESTFEKDFLMEGLTFSCTDSQNRNVDLDFRNTRFFESVTIREIKLTDTSQDTKVTFEDARISKNFLILNSEFQHAKLYCFQTVFVKYSGMPTKKCEHKVEIIKTHFESDAQIDFVDCDIRQGMIVLDSVPILPNANLCFAETEDGCCPNLYVGIHNCEITGFLNLSNIQKLSFYQSKNSGKILADTHWAEVPKGQWKKNTKGVGRTSIVNKLLLAVYNNDQLCPNCANRMDNEKNQLLYAKAQDFIMLKENFSSCGMYDAEDVAFILYMEHKPIVDSVNSGIPKEKAKPNKFYAALYKVLLLTGKYGISPLRVLGALLITVALFAALYFGVNKTISLQVQGNGYENESTLKTGFYLGGIVAEPNTLGGQIMSSVLYSLRSVIPFTAQFKPCCVLICILSAIESFIGSFLIGYFSVAVVRKTLR